MMLITLIIKKALKKIGLQHHLVDFFSLIMKQFTAEKYRNKKAPAFLG